MKTKILLLLLLCGNYLFAQQQALLDSVPFLLRDHMYVNVEGEHGYVFDTGAGRNLVFDEAISHPNQITTKPLRVIGVAGVQELKQLQQPFDFVLGNKTLHFPSAIQMDLRSISGCHANGLLGLRDLTENRLMINFQHSFLKELPLDAPIPEGYVKLPLRVENNLQVKVSGQIGKKNFKGWFVIDTGSGTAISFTAAATRKLGLEKLDLPKTIYDVIQMGIGDSLSWAIQLPTAFIKLGDTSVEHLLAACSPDGKGSLGKTRKWGIIGLDLLKNFNLIIDVPHHCLYVKAFREAPLKKPTFGVGVRNRIDVSDAWIAASLARNGIAARAGLCLGDSIIAINGKNVRDYLWADEEAVFLSDTLNLTVRPYCPTPASSLPALKQIRLIRPKF